MKFDVWNFCFDKMYWYPHFDIANASVIQNLLDAGEQQKIYE